ncbi:MAG TPA: hypothetical protein VI911_08580 [Patescibacteria group bacterium]|nr:MAG: hypothetical protein UR43_C0005G0117 [candidate division TM6 bacterium GW2011_GWF2_33_332]HLD91051.1 hypothetical protein [Patescibacteria group bacterium]
MSRKLINFSELKNVTFNAIDNTDDIITFYCDNGDRYEMYHEQDCCEKVYIEDINGNLDDLLNSPILLAEETTNNENPKNTYDDSFTWTFYKLATIKGYVDIRWYGESNGYYSESVEVYKISKEKE